MITSTKVVAFTCFDPFILAAFSTSLAPCPAMEALCRQTPKAVAALSICSGRPPPRASSLRPRRLRSRWWKAREFPTEVLREFSAELVKVYMVKGRNPKKPYWYPKTTGECWWWVYIISANWPIVSLIGLISALVAFFLVAEGWWSMVMVPFFWWLKCWIKMWGLNFQKIVSQPTRNGQIINQIMVSWYPLVNVYITMENHHV